MNLSAGNGSVTIKNAVLYGSASTEKICATKHCNGIDYWIITHDWNSTNFRNFLLTAGGVNTSPQNSAIGSSQGPPNGFLQGAMKVSPTGRKLALTGQPSTCEVFDFDATTGTLSNTYTLNVPNAYALDFSPDGTKLYCSGTALGSGSNFVSQFDICAGSATAIASSQYSMNLFPAGAPGAIQLAKNGKIYISHNGASFLSVINSPNSSGSACNLAVLSQSLGTKVSWFGLPNFCSNYFLTKAPLPPFAYTINNTITCNAANFSVPISSLQIGCSGAGYSLTSWNWNFGDPTSGASNTSTLTNPFHGFSAGGNYTVLLIANYSCGASADTIFQTLNLSQPCVTIQAAVSCSALGTATAFATGGGGPYTYTWLPSQQTGSICNTVIPGSHTLLVGVPNSTVPYPIVYNFSATTAFTGQIASNSITCNGYNNGTASLTIQGGSALQNYIWTIGASSFSSSSVSNLPPGIFTVQVIDALTQCAFTSTFQINQPSIITVTGSALNPTICSQGIQTLSAFAQGGTGSLNYIWSNSATSSVTTISSTIVGQNQVTLTVTDINFCSNVALVNYTTMPLPNIILATATICPNTTTTLVASGATSYTWLASGLQSASITLTPSVTAVYTVVGSSNACLSNQTTTVSIFPLPILSFASYSITCASLGSATVSANGGIGPFNYTWSPNNQFSPNVAGLSPGTYSVTVLDVGSNCVLTDTITFNSLVPLGASIISSASVSCNGASTATAMITNISGGSAIQNYFWTNALQTSTLQAPSNLSAGAWSVSITDALTGCQVNSVITILQPAALSPTLTISTNSVCLDTSAVLSASCSGGLPAYTYSYVNGPGTFTYNVIETVAGIKVYTVVCSDVNNCLSTANVSLNVIATPTISATNVIICPAATASIIVLGAINYTLTNTSIGSVFGTANTATNNFTFTDSPIANSQYTLIGSALGCTSSINPSVSLFPNPIPVISTNSPRCQGDNVFLSVTGGTSAVWAGPNIYSSTSLSNTLLTVGFANAGVYSTTITSVDGCTASATSILAVNPTPTLSVAGSTVCTTQTMALFANSLAGSSYLWSGPNGFASAVQNPTLASPTINRTGSYTVIVTVPSTCTNTAIAQVSITTPPSLTFSLSSNSLCAQAFNGSPNTITLTSSGAHTYTLYTPNLLGSSTPVSPSASLFATPPFSSSLATGMATLQGSNGVCT